MSLLGGNGPPILLLHGYPQSHIEWRKIAPDLSKDYTLVMPDLRGYGDSGKPPAGDNHINYSKRAMALDQVEVMEKLGFRQFALVSHDRGSRVAHRLTLVVHHSGFDVDTEPFEDGQVFGWQENLDASGNAGLAANKTVPFEGDDHLVDRRWADTEMALDVGFSGGLSEHVGIGMYESEVVPLLLGQVRA